MPEISRPQDESVGGVVPARGICRKERAFLRGIFAAGQFSRNIQFVLPRTDFLSRGWETGVFPRKIRGEGYCSGIGF
jgi:hypothetical protein